MSENSDESLSFDFDTANHNTWYDVLSLVTHCDLEDRIQANLEDEELGRLGLSCHNALDWLCAELEALWHRVCSSVNIE